MMLCALFLLLGSSLTMAQIPANGDTEVAAAMVVAVHTEKVEMKTAEVQAKVAMKEMLVAMEEEEEVYEEKRLVESGSLIDASGEPILANVEAAKQVIDPRTPQGFGDPFFRKIHVELNQEMDLPPAFLEVLDNVTSEVNNTDFENVDVFHIDLESFSTHSPITHSEDIFFTRKNVENNDLTITWQSHLVRQKHENGTDVDRNTTNRCRHVKGKDTICKESYSEYNSYWEAEIDPFPNGVCPNPCECLRGIINGAMKQAIAIHKCETSCAKTDQVSVITCADFRSKAERAKKMIMIVFEAVGGWHGGKKVKRNHPLGGDVRRFIGTF